MNDHADHDLILLLATSSASLDKSPKHNWVEDAGGLPPYVRKLARAIAKNGHSLSSAISIAISRIKVWAAGGGGVDADTKAKAAKALAQWEALKAKNAAGGVIKASRDDNSSYLMLTSISSFNTEIVRNAWEAQERERRRSYEAARTSAPSPYSDTVPASDYPYRWICELGTDYVIVTQEDNRGVDKYRFPYTVDEDYEVEFGTPVRIVQIWVEDNDDLTHAERAALGNILSSKTPLTRIVEAAKRSAG